MQNNDEERKGSRAAPELHARLPPQKPAFRCPLHPRAGGLLQHSAGPGVGVAGEESPCPRPPEPVPARGIPGSSGPAPPPTWERSRPLASRSRWRVFRETWARLLLRARDEDGADDERETRGS